MNQVKVINFTLIGVFVLMLCAFVFVVQSTSGIIVTDSISTTVSAFCG